jgi:cell wall-associated NlpC family hydrolase
MRIVLYHLRQNIQRKSIFTILIFATLSFTIVSCSKKQLPVSSARYTQAPVAATPEMQIFMNGGIGRNLDTGRKKPKQIIKTAEKYIGTPHCMGGTSKKCIDCSGLTFVSFAKHKIEIPRNSQEQARYGRIIFDRNDLKKGDLVFFTKSYSTSDYITHVGIYLGNGKFIHASTSAGVTETPLNNPWWNQRFVFGTRIF